MGALPLALFVAAMIWYVCARALAASAASGLTYRFFELSDFQPLIDALCLVFLVVGGFAALRSIERRQGPLRDVLGLPARATARGEWGMGAALGWGLALVSAAPLALAGRLDVEFWISPRAFELMGISLATLAVATLAHAIAIFGYPFQRLIEATGPVRATLVLLGIESIRSGLVPAMTGTADGARLMVALLVTVLLSLCWFRTHGLWLLWGLDFAWMAATGVLFGLPVGGDNSFGSVVDTRTAGPAWLTGGSFGPLGAALSIMAVLAAIPVLMRLTGDYAWEYTRRPIIAAGYDVTIAPPAAHAALEQERTADAAGLVQILPAGPPAGAGPNGPPEQGPVEG